MGHFSVHNEIKKNTYNGSIHYTYKNIYYVLRLGHISKTLYFKNKDDMFEEPLLLQIIEIFTIVLNEFFSIKDTEDIEDI